MGGQAGTPPPIRREGSFSTDNALPGSPRGREAELRPRPGPLEGAELRPPPGTLTLFNPTPHRADLPAPGSQAEGSRLQTGLTRSGQRWGEGEGPARKRPARQPLVSTPWLPATGPGTPPREGVRAGLAIVGGPHHMVAAAVRLT